MSFKTWNIFTAIPFLLYNEFYKIILRKGLNKCTKIFPVSNAMKTMLISNGIPKEKLEVIHNPVEMHTKKSNNLKKELGIENQKVILYAGRLAEDKGIQNTINAIKDMPNVTFIIIGTKRNYHDTLKKLSIDLGMEDRVKFIGFVPNAELDKYYSITDLVVHVCGFYEPLSRMLLETTSYGIPIISSSAGGNPEIVTNNKNGFLIDDYEQIENKIKEVLDNPNLLKTMGDNSKEISKEKFGIKRIGQKLFNQLNKK